MKRSCVWLLGLWGGLLGGLPAMAEDTLYAGFQDPPAEARPWVRWWWNGNRISEPEILRELDLLRAAGIGGVEINPIALHAQADPHGIPAVPWLSDAWNRLARVAVDGAHARGMLADMIVGSGWPFGGRFLEPNETIEGIRVHRVDVVGPRDLDTPVTSLRDTEPVPFQDAGASPSLAFLRLVPVPLNDLDACRDLRGRVDAGGRLRVHVPAGTYALYVGWRRQRFREVMHGAPGADGPVLDHFNRRAVERYLNRMSDKLGPALGGRLGDGLRALFCDSIELSGANWTDDLPAEFRRRCGYDLAPYLPFVLHPELAAATDAVRDRIRRARYDFSRTLVALYQERFVRVFHAWCHDQGALSRYQSYGHPWLLGMLDGYRVPDIPEGDTWLYNDWQGLDEIRYAVWNRYAASGGHVAGRSLIGCEAITNTSGVFRATPAYIKQACDLSLISGVNHLILHGFNYSPPEVPFPGWIRYGTYLNENNPWWPYLRHWADYSGRLSAVLQQSHPVIEVAILGPEADVWSDHGLDRNPFVNTPDYLHTLWQAFSRNGCGADYLSEAVVQEAVSRDGALHCGPMAYRLLILTEVHSLQPATAAALARYVRAGGTLVSVGDLPARSPALRDAAAGDAAVRRAMTELREQGGARVLRVAPPRIETVTAWVGRVLDRARVRRAVTFTPVDERLFQIHHRAGDRDLFFLVNLHRDRAVDTQADFAVPAGRRAWRWDAETGKRSVYPLEAGIHLEPLESLLLVFEARAGTVVRRPSVDGPSVTLSAPWTLHLEPVRGEPWRQTLPELVDLGQADDPRLRAFGGTVTYRLSFTPGAGDWTLLDLGTVHGVSEVTLNGRPLGLRWWGRHRYELAGALRPGTNDLEVRVATVLANYCRSLRDNPVARVWTARRKTPAPIGLIGPVRLVRRVTSATTPRPETAP